MSPVKYSKGLAAGMGRWSANHWKTAVFGWLALVAAAFAIGGAVGTNNIDPNAAGPGESGRMNRILDAGFKQPAGESVLIQSRSLRVGDRAFTAAIEDVVARVSKAAAVQNVRSPLDRAHAGQIAKDRQAALVEFDIRGDEDKAANKIAPVLDTVADAQRAHPGFFIGEFGDASAAKAVDTVFADDLASAGVYSIPITLIILVVAFGALVAAGIPLLLALTAVFATFGVTAVASHVIPLAEQASAVVLLIGLAVGVDYSMFYLKRERQERAAGRSERDALAAAAATSGRSVLVSGLTVMVAMAGLFLTGDATFASFGYATMIVVALAVLGSLTVLPALLSKLGDRVDRLHVPLVGRLRHHDGEGRIWGGIVDRVLRRPLLSAVLAGGVLLALATPALQLRIATPGPEAQFPKSLDIIKAYDRMQQAFPGTALPANVVVKAPNVNEPAVRDAIDRLEQRARESGQIGEPITVDVNEDATVANITVPIAGTGTDPASNTALAELRDEIVPETVGALPGTDAGVTGQTAEWKDEGDQMKSKLPLVVAFVLVFAFALMLVAFRSLVIAVKAIVLNLLSVAAAYGVLVLVFQHGIGKGLLGFDETSGITPVVPLLLFVILFGLSMDYHVFILSRIRESFDRGVSMDDAVAHGIKSTAGVVTSAAIVMIAVFSVFAALSMLFFKQFGVGLATAILIDATIIRAVLLPATMKLLGEWNWYLPKWLNWLPRLGPAESGALPKPAGNAFASAQGPMVSPAGSLASPWSDRERSFAMNPSANEQTSARVAEPKRVLTPARIAALALIGVLVLGLACLRLGTGGSAVSVPSGAKAGDLKLERCDYATENGSYAADCGTLVVPENRADPKSRLIALPVTRIRAQSERPAEPIFVLQGGPGITNMQFEHASRFAENHDVVLVGYRGVDGSVRLDCPEVESALKRSTDVLAQKSFGAYADAFRACATRLTDDGADLAGYSFAQQADDLEAARKALAYERIDLLSESAGTRLALVYAWRHPASIHRSVMIGVNPPGHFLWEAETTDQQIGRYADLCARDESCSTRTDDLAATMRRTDGQIPDRWLFLPIEQDNVRVASFMGLMESRTSEAAPVAAPMILDAWLSAANGDASGFWFASVLGDLLFPKLFVWGEYAAVGRADAQAARDHFSARAYKRGSNLGEAATAYIWGGGRLADAWPAAPGEAEYSRMRTSKVETLLIGGALDVSTPPQVATKELLPYLPNGHEVVLPGLGHTGSFFAEQPEAGSRLINTFFDSGRVEDSHYQPATVDFTPTITAPMLTKIIAGSIVALALLTVLSLAWMALSVHRRGRYGRKASATLRTLYPIVLGVGGWSLGVLIVLTTMPGVPLDDDLLAALSVGGPIGLGIYLAWADRDWSAWTKATGFAAAAAGALVGAWLGFNATEDLVALLTAIVGSAVGANLILLVLDIAWDRQVRDRYAATNVKETFKARPSTS
jgi:uncharacterized membrane protein YdfJ with MMPL/SSD domain/pimeloyl-ACP methyl ester carboxylesterase